MKTKIKIFLFFCIINHLGNNVLKAQDFEVAPVVLDFSAEPGENQIKTIAVKNHSNHKASFIIAIADFLPSSNGEKVIMAPNSTKRSCANWININPSFFELNPGEDINLQISMLVPSQEFSAAWCVLYIQPTREQTNWSADKSLGAGVVVGSRIGVYVLQSPKSNSNHSLKISNLKEENSNNFANSGRRFSATIENLGEKITFCKVYLVAANMNTAEEKQFGVIDVETFPKMSRSVELILPNELESGKYSLAAIVDYGSKYALEGTQVMIDVKVFDKSIKPDTTVILKDSTLLK
ncbi:MAG: hypothetical protein AB9846_09290 [Tenuifilaceae bacterium]